MCVSVPRGGLVLSRAAAVACGTDGAAVQEKVRVSRSDCRQRGRIAAERGAPWEVESARRAVSRALEAWRTTSPEEELQLRVGGWAKNYVLRQRSLDSRDQFFF